MAKQMMTLGEMVAEGRTFTVNAAETKVAGDAITAVTSAIADLDAAVALRYEARDRYLASGTQVDLDALNAAVELQDEASAALAKLGR